MKKIKARGLVLREFEAGESDKRLLLLCKGHGRMFVYARGARKPRSKFLAAAQPFTYSDFILTEGRGFYSVASADVIESFYALRTNYDRLCAAYSVASVCEKILWDNANCDGLLLLALKSLSVLAKGKIPPIQAEGVFLTRFFAFYGLSPQMGACVICNLPVNEMTGGIFFGTEGVLCETHKSRNAMPLSPAAAAACSHILNSELPRAFQFTAHENVLAEIRSANKLLWDSHFAP